jgi:MHS family alpha-ketoglutarate permease-like MFS transporter
VLLLFARLLQGLSVGGEYGTSATYMSEVAIGGQRGFYASFQYVTLIGGQLLAVLVVVVVLQFMTEAEIKDWGWRIPFFIGAATAVVAFYLRRSLEETSSTETRQRKEAGSLGEIFRHHARAFCIVLGFTAGGSLIFYTFTTYMQKYLVNTAGMDAKTASRLMTVVLFVYMIMQPLFGAISDKIGRKTSMMLFGGLATLATIPILSALSTIKDPIAAFFLITAALAVVSFYTSISGLVKAELFPAQIRALSVGFSYAIANAIFGGSAEYVALWFKSVGHETWFFWYVTIMVAISFIFALIMPDSRKQGYLQGHGTE